MKAISYVRYSSARQAKGDSFRRQTEASERYAAEHGLVIDKSVTYTDEGVSAYDKSNIKKGALGLLLKAVEHGRVQAGTTLIVESLDRLSRAQVLDALEVFISILNAGLIVVTLIDKQVYSRASVTDNFGQLLTSIVIMQRAYDESATKSARVSAAWSRKFIKAQSGVIITKKIPSWIRVVGDKFELIPERAEVVRMLVKQSLAGVGNGTLIKQLHADGVAAWSKSEGWQPSYMQKLFKSPALYGAIKLKDKLLEGYYPALMTAAEYHHLQRVRSSRRKTQATSQRGEVTNLFTRKLKCGYCGSPMNVAGYKSTKVNYDRKYVACHGARTAKTKCRMTMWFIDQLEPKLLFWLTTVNYKALFAVDGTALQESRKGLTELEGVVEELKRQRGAIADAVALRQSSETLLDRLDELELKTKESEGKLEALRRSHQALVDKDLSGSSRMQALLALFKLLKGTSAGPLLRGYRQQLCDLIDSAVERIVLFPLGPTRKGKKEDRYLVVTLRNGATYEIDDSDDRHQSLQVDPEELKQVTDEG